MVCCPLHTILFGQDMKGKIQLTLLSFLVLFTNSTVAEPLHWQASKGGHTLLILGSIHLGTPDMYPLPERVVNFLKSSDGLVTEIDLNATGQQSITADKQALTREILDNTQLTSLSKINRILGYPDKAFFDLPAWQTALTLQVGQLTSLGYKTELGIDNYFTALAATNKIPVFGLESAGYQLGLFTDDARISEWLLTNTVDYWQENQRISRCLADSWKSGDAAHLASLAEESKINDFISERFIYKRNRNWAEKLSDHQFLKDGRYLVVVGALHLVGEQNLIQLLKQKGYQIERLSTPEAVSCN